MEQGKTAVGVSVHPYPHLDVVAAVLIPGDLKDEAVEPDTVVVADGTLILFAEDILEGRSGPGHKHAEGLLRGKGKLSIIGGQIDAGKILIGLLHASDASHGKLFERSLLVSTEGPFRPSPGLR